MVADVYATRADLHKYGLPRGLLGNPGRLCASVLAATDTFEIDGSFETDDALLFRAEAGGVLPAPIVAGVTYYAIRLSDSTFKASATISGSAIDLTTDGESVVVSAALPFDEVLEFYSRFVDGCIPHAVPLAAPYPVIVVAIVAELSAKKLLMFAGQSSQSMTEFELAAKAQLERWYAGAPIRDARASAPTNLAVAEQVLSDPRGWGSGSCLP